MQPDGRTHTTPGTALVVRDLPELASDHISLAEACARYMAFKHKRLTTASQRSYTACLRDLISFFPDRPISTFEPPIGAGLLEDFLVARYGHLSGRTYNRGLSVISDFRSFVARLSVAVAR